MSILVLFIGWGLIALQGRLSFKDNFYARWQIAKYYRSEFGENFVKKSYSFKEHGGITADIFIITPLVAWMVKQYDLQYVSLTGLIALVVCTLFILCMGWIYAEGSKKTPEFSGMLGTTSAAGWVHGLYALPAMWVIVLFFLKWSNPLLEKKHLLWAAAIITVFFPIGAAKWSMRWWEMFKRDTGAKVQIAGGIALVWIVTSIRFATM